MPDDDNKKVILAVETAVLGGSLALASGNEIIDSWLGGNEVSRSEDLLVSIAELLGRNSLTRRNIGAIAVSNGPGSYTGIRVGIATALGLKNALHIPCIGISVLDAMGHGQTKKVITAIPVGRGDICWQSGIEERREAALQVGTEENFLTCLLSHEASIDVIAHEYVFERIRSKTGAWNLIDAGNELAQHLGLFARGREDTQRIEPIYIRDFV